MEIEKGIPIPPKMHLRTQKVRELVEKMEIGDSILADTLGGKSTVLKCGKRFGISMAERKMRDGWRIWRTA